MINVEVLRLDVSSLGHITNTYIIYDDEKTAVLIDPADEANKILNCLKKNNLNLKYVFITHVHADHIAALEEVVANTNAKVLVHEKDYEKFFDINASYADILNVKLPNLDWDNIIKITKEEDYINVGKLNFYIINTPGHTSGSIVIYEKNTNILFSGDTMFSNSYGRCDLITGSFENMKNSLNKLFSKFEDNVRVLPGHGQEAFLQDIKKKLKLLLAIKRG